MDSDDRLTAAISELRHLNDSLTRETPDMDRWIQLGTALQKTHSAFVHDEGEDVQFRYADMIATLGHAYGKELEGTGRNAVVEFHELLERAFRTFVGDLEFHRSCMA